MNTKFKRFTIITCLVTFLFLPFRPQKVNAVAVVDDMFWVLFGITVLASGGVYLSSVEMQEDAGSRVGNALKDFVDVTVGENSIQAKVKDGLHAKAQEFIMGEVFNNIQQSVLHSEFPTSFITFDYNKSYGSVVVPVVLQERVSFNYSLTRNFDGNKTGYARSLLSGKVYSIRTVKNLDSTISILFESGSDVVKHDFNRYMTNPSDYSLSFTKATVLDVR